VHNLRAINTNLALYPRRDEDRGDTLWQVMNVVQEKLLRGGIPYTINQERKDVC